MSLSPMSFATGVIVNRKKKAKDNRLKLVVPHLRRKGRVTLMGSGMTVAYDLPMALLRYCDQTTFRDSRRSDKATRMTNRCV